MNVMKKILILLPVLIAIFSLSCTNSKKVKTPSDDPVEVKDSTLIDKSSNDSLGY